jgi:hypothetical protein
MILAFLVPVSSVSAERFLPEVDSTQTGYVFYGGGTGQQAWFVSTLLFPTDSPSTVLDALDDTFDLTISDTFIWTRVSGNVWTQSPEQAMDYIIGTDFQKGNLSSSFPFYLRQERIVFTNPHINNNYTGLGTKWSSDNISAEVFASTDMNDSYKATFHGQYASTENLTFSTDVWLLIDDAANDVNYDGWGWWRVMAENKLDKASSIVFVYEDSTRSDPLYLVGFGYKL